MQNCLRSFDATDAQMLSDSFENNDRSACVYGMNVGVCKLVMVQPYAIAQHWQDAHLPYQVLHPATRYTTEFVTHGQCNSRPVIPNYTAW